MSCEAVLSGAAATSSRLRPQHGKPAICRCPTLAGMKPGATKQFCKRIHRVLARVLGMNPLPLAKPPPPVRPVHLDITPRLQVHLDARITFIEERDMPPMPRIEVRPHAAVQVAQQVEVER